MPIIAALLAVVGVLIWLLCRFLKSTAIRRDWRAILTVAGFALSVVSVLLVAGYLVNAAATTDALSSTSEGRGISLLVKWGHWGVRVGGLGAVSSLLGRRWIRVVPLVVSLLFGAFWIVIYANY